MFHLSVVLKEGDIVGHRLDAKDYGVFVIHFNGDLAHVMLDARALNTGVKVITHFVLIMTCEFAAEKRGNIFWFN
jgi:hypothetical protein